MNDLFTLDRKGENHGGQVIWREDQLTYLIEQYNMHHSIPTLAKQFGTSPECIRTQLRKLGVKVLSLRELQTLDFPRNSHYFETIDTKDKAYWLGFLMADGCVTEKSVGIRLSKRDEDHVQKFYDVLEATNHKIRYSSKIMEDKIFYMAAADIKDPYLVGDLKRLGCIPNKTHTMHFPTKEEVPEELLSHYVRGYFDGDGSLYYTQCGKARRPNWRLGFSCGDKTYLEALRHLFNKDNVAIEDRTTYFILQISGNKQLVPIMQYIYKDATDDIMLLRKKQKYEQFLLQSLGGEPVNTGCEQDSFVR